MKMFNKKLGISFFLMFLALQYICSEDINVVVHSKGNSSAIAVDSVASINLSSSDSVSISGMSGESYVLYDYDSLTYSKQNKDTLFLKFSKNDVEIHNPRLNKISVQRGLNKCDIVVNANNMPELVIMATGKCKSGSIFVNADTTYTIRFADLNLTSTHSPVFYSASKQKVCVELAEGTDNIFTDAKKYEIADDVKNANGCISCIGAVSFKGSGSLTVYGKNKHAIYSKKSITFKEGSYNVYEAVSDAIHSGKNINVDGGVFFLSGMLGEAFDMDEDFCMNNGTIDMFINGEAAKGINSAGFLKINDGTINATASGALKNKNGDLSYCTILKCDSSMIVTGGNFYLANSSPGGKCISVTHNLEITGGSFYLETSGDGAEYTNIEGKTDYYTSKCISVNDTLLIQRGYIECLSTGKGGKGIDCGKELTIGTFQSQNHELIKINVTTTGTSIINDVEEDKRFGCPKAFKSDDQLDILSGTINVTTKGMGGEGFESRNEMWIVDGNIICDTFDDCFNAGNLIYVYGGNIYCCSHDNDGFDSNGRIVIEGGNIFSASLHPQNESFDTEGNTLVIKGGNILGIGGGKVVPEQSYIPFYSYTLWDNQIVQQPMPIISLTGGNCLTVMKDNRYVISGYIPANFTKSIITIASPLLNSRQQYTVAETGVPKSGASYCEGLFYTNGSLSNVIAEKFSFTPNYYSHQK